MKRIPVGLKFMALAASVTAFYSFVGQMLPQTEIHPPRIAAIEEEEEEEDDDGGAERMVRRGREIFEGKGTCTVCHTLGSGAGPSPFPDLDGIGARAGERVAGLDSFTYLAQSLLEPNAFIVPGFNPGMPVVTQPPASLTDGETLAVIAYLQSLGGEPTVTAATRLPHDRLASLSGHGELNGSAPPAAAGTVVTAAANLAPSPAVPASLEPAPAVPDDPRLANGKRLYDQTCFACHGKSAEGNELLNAPRLAGQESWYVARQLENFASGARGSDPRDVFGMQMRPMAMVLAGDGDIEAVAAYLSSLR